MPCPPHGPRGLSLLALPSAAGAALGSQTARFETSRSRRVCQFGCRTSASCGVLRVLRYQLRRWWMAANPSFLSLLQITFAV